MTTKLTLTIEEKVIKSAKRYASKKGRSLSRLVENYLRSLSEPDESDADTSPRVKRLLGSIQLPSDFDYKSSLEESISKKYKK